MYRITKTQDISRPRAKRFLAHVTVHTTNKDTIKKIIQEVTEIVKHTNQCLPKTKERFGDESAHVVWLYVHFAGRIICQSMWVTDKKTFTVDHPEEPYAVDIRFPKQLNYNDYAGDVVVMWRA